MNMMASTQRFVDQTGKMARKYHAKVSISVPGEKEVVIADERIKDTGHEDAETIISLEEMVKTGVQSLERINEEIKKLNEMLESALLNEESYRIALEEVKKLNKERLKIKMTILEVPATKQLAEKLKDLKVEKKELIGAQGEYLREYTKLSGSTQLELFDGSTADIIPVYKLIKSKKG